MKPSVEPSAVESYATGLAFSARINTLRFSTTRQSSSNAWPYSARPSPSSACESLQSQTTCIPTLIYLCLQPTPPPNRLNEERHRLVAVSVPPDSMCRATSASSSGENASSSQDEDPELEQHTLSSYGDLSFSDGFILSSDDPDPPQPAVEAIQPKLPYARPRFRLKVRRPQMPKRRLSYVHAGAPFPGTVNRKIEDGNWPGSPRNVCSSPFAGRRLMLMLSLPFRSRFGTSINHWSCRYTNLHALKRRA